MTISNEFTLKYIMHLTFLLIRMLNAT